MPNRPGKYEKIECPGATYDDLKAQGLPNGTAYRAARRGWYLRRVDPDDSPKAKPGLEKRVVEALTDERIHTSQITSVAPQKIWDVKRGESSFTENEVKRLRQEVTALRNLLRRFTEDGGKEALKEVVGHPLVCQHALFRGERLMLVRLSRGRNVYLDEVDRARAEAEKLYGDLEF